MKRPGKNAQSPSGRVMLAGVEVREDDVEPQTGLHIAAVVFRVCAAVIFLLAMWQLVAWWMDRPPGGIGVGVIVGDTIRLVVFSGLLYAAGDLANLMVKTHHDLRASRVLLARQTYMMRQWGIAEGMLPITEGMPPEQERRGIDAEDTVAHDTDPPV